MITDALGQDGVGPEDAASAAAPAPAVLPRRRRNNSISISPPRYKLKAIGERRLVEDLEWDDDFGEWVGTVDNLQDYEARDGRTWQGNPDGLLKLASETSTSERKTVFQFRGNVESFIAHFGRNRCAFWTITDQDKVHPREFAKRWNSFRTNEGSFINAFMRVLEPQKNGRPHYHFLVAVAWDLEPEKFDWNAFKQANASAVTGNHKDHLKYRAQYVASTPPQTRELWSRLRDILSNYGLDRSEFLPIRRDGPQVAEYIAKYLEAGLKLRRHEWKGCRRVEYSRGKAWRWKTHGRHFSWMTDKAKQWRKRVGAIAKTINAANLDDIANRLGKKWAYHLRNDIINLSDEKFQVWLTTDLQLVRDIEDLIWKPENWRNHGPCRPQRHLKRCNRHTSSPAIAGNMLISSHAPP